ncbi:MAG: hypothetical protein KJ858_06890 [Nanoarchaeota archaeon]|nr:hypothetical protein [Nanoarchaeota archaeon]
MRKTSKIISKLLILSFLGGCAPEAGFMDFMDSPFKTTAKNIRYLTGGNMKEEGPTIVCVGDIDGDSKMEWEYHNNGKTYRAEMIFTKRSEQHLKSRHYSKVRDNEFNVMSFHYYDYEERKEFRVPDNFSTIGCR